MALLKVSLPYALFRAIEAGEITSEQFATRALNASRRLDQLDRATMVQTRALLRDLDRQVRDGILSQADTDALSRGDINRVIDRSVDDFIERRRSLMQRSTQQAVDLAQDFRQKIANIARQPAPQATVPANLAQDLTAIQADANQAMGDSIRNRLKLKIAQGVSKGLTPRQVAAGIVAERVVTPRRNVDDAAQHGAVGKAQVQTTSELRQAFNTANYASSRAEQRGKAGILKTWVAQGPGPGRRESHQEAAARYAVGGTIGPIPLHHKFRVGKVWMRFPCDPAAPIGETIGCQCLVVEIVPEVEERLDQGAAVS